MTVQVPFYTPLIRCYIYLRTIISNERRRPQFKGGVKPTTLPQQAALPVGDFNARNVLP